MRVEGLRVEGISIRHKLEKEERVHINYRWLKFIKTIGSVVMEMERVNSIRHGVSP